MKGLTDWSFIEREDEQNVKAAVAEHRLLVGPPENQGYPGGCSGQGLKLITHVALASKIKQNRAVCTFSHTRRGVVLNRFRADLFG